MALAAPEEKAALREFRAKIPDIILQFNEFEQHEIFAMMWLRARDLNVKKAEEMIRKSFQWRKINKIDTLLATWTPPESYPKKFPYDLCGYDKEGFPILLVPIGRWDVRAVVDAGEAKTWLKYNQMLSLIIIEDAKRIYREKGIFVSQCNVIVDMKGFGLRQITSRGCIEAHMDSVRQYEDNYPESLKTGIIINAPRIFAILFNIVKPLLSAHTLSKLNIFDSNEAKWKAAILNNLPADQLPVEYGGTKKSADILGFGELSLADEDLTEITVDAGGELNLDYTVEVPQSTICWKFKTTNYDIGFSIKSNGKEVVPYERVDTLNSLQEGTYLSEKTGKYTVIFDNTYSRLRSKNLLYNVTIYNRDDGKIPL